MLTDFYSATAQASLTLLGLWWLVLAAWPQSWVDDPARRRTGYHIALYFMLPALMSVMSLLSTDSPFFWRAGFGLACVIGAAENLSYLGHAVVPRWFVYLSVALYAAAGAIALAPQLVTDVFDVTALHVEGALLTTILFLGLNLAWMHMVRRD